MLEWIWCVLVPRRSHRNLVRWGSTRNVWTFLLCGLLVLAPCCSVLTAPCLSSRIGLHFIDATGFQCLLEAARYSARARQVLCWDVQLRKCCSTLQISCCLLKLGIIPAALPSSQCHPSFKWPTVMKRSGPGSDTWSQTRKILLSALSCNAVRGHAVLAVLLVSLRGHSFTLMLMLPDHCGQLGRMDFILLRNYFIKDGQTLIWTP